MIYQSLVYKAKYLADIFYLACIYCLLIFVTLPAYSSATLYSLNTENKLASQSIDVSGNLSHPIAAVHLDNTNIASLAEGIEVEVPMPDGKVAKGQVIKLIGNSKPSQSLTTLSATQRKIISLDNNAGSVTLVLVNNVVSEMVLHDVIEARIYHADINSNGDGQLYLQDNNDYYCVKYPENKTPAQPITQLSPQVAAAIPSVLSLRNLQSRPGSVNVLFIDYWGGTVTGTAWNADNSNNPIDYTAYDTDGNPGSFSQSERYSMWLAWREAVEDFAPFDINITTSRSVYNATAVADRAQMIVTTSSSWYGNAGGVAYVNVFDDNSGFYKTAWTWNLSDRSMGMTISHEAGHQMGLRHDGTGSSSYYGGHGVWGPIMGAPFGKPYVQWSKGEYPNADRSEDDIAIVTSKLGLIADEAGNGYSSATSLNLPVNNKKGLIGPGDTDAYKFTLSSAASVNVKVISLLGDEDESRAANLAMNVSLAKINASGTVISTIKSINSSANQPLSPLTNEFEYTGTLGSGTYGLRVTPASPDTNWATGFGNYGNLGEYRFTVSSTPQNEPDLIVQAVSVNDSTLTPGQNFSISASVKNQGNAGADSSTLRYFLSPDSAISTDDEQLSTDQIPALSVNGNSPQNATVSAPNTDGTYWVGACVDTISGESNRQNNCSAAVQVTVNPPPSPDLIISQLNLSRLSFTPGQSFTIEATVKNQGNAGASTSTLKYYRSADSSIDTSDRLLSTDIVANLAANASSDQSATVNSPNTTGNYWIGVCVDVVNNESNRQNNCSAAIQITVTNATAPELVVNSVTLSASSLKPNQQFNISARAVNRGTAASNSSILRYFLSINSTISRADYELGRDSISILAPDKGSRQSIDVSAPPATGIYWIGACVDSVANESNTNNNCSSGSQIEVINKSIALPTDECTIFIIPAKNNKSVVFCL